MKCPNCGAEVSETAKFCPSCGFSLGQAGARVEHLRSRQFVEALIPPAPARGLPMPPPSNSLIPNLKAIFNAVFKPRAPLSLGPTPSLSHRTADVAYVIAIAVLLGAGLAVAYGIVRVSNLFVFAFFLSLIPTGAYLALVYLSDRFEREPPLLVALAFAWGAASTLPAVLVNDAVASAIGFLLAPVVSAPIAEEFFKSIFVYYMFTRSRLSAEVNSLTDGFVYGFASGLGFGFVENIIYMATIASTSSTIDAVVIRSLTVLMHGFTTGIVGWWLAYMKLRGVPYAGRMWDLAAPLVFAICVHAVWNGTNILLILLGARMAPLAIITLYFVGIAYLTRKIIGEAIRDEVLR